MEHFKNKWVARKGCRETRCLEITEAPKLDSFYDCMKQRNTAKPPLSPSILYCAAIRFSNTLLRKRLHYLVFIIDGIFQIAAQQCKQATLEEEWRTAFLKALIYFLLIFTNYTNLW